MINNLPSFQIDVTEEANPEGKTTLHHISLNTNRICSEINQVMPLNVYAVDTKKDDAAIVDRAGSYYTAIASRLSALDNQQLMERFSDIRVFYKSRRLQKHFAFIFNNQH